jgi:phosphonate transport system permease protein
MPRSWRGANNRSLWLGVLTVVVAWSTWTSGVGRRQVVNTGGWSLIRSFFSAAFHPDLSAAFLRDVRTDALTTIGFAVLGTVLAVLVGFVLGLFSSATLWRCVGTRTRFRRMGWRASRMALSIPRGIHEIVWGLFFVSTLGLNPLVPILALGIPFGAITAKVYAELIDDASPKAFSNLTATGAPTTSAVFYGVIPTVAADMVSYAFYRLECAVRSAAVVGFIGAGGLGFRLKQSNDGNAFGEVWTIIYVLVGLCLLGEQWSSLMRRVDARWVRISSVCLGSILTVWSWLRLNVHLSTLWSDRSRQQFRLVARSAWPPHFPRGGWQLLGHELRTTFEMSLLAMVMAVMVAMPLAVMAARPIGQRRTGFAELVFRHTVRVVVLVVRAVPVTLWALLVVLVVLPGVLPGAVALAIYTSAVLVRLFSELLENQEPSAQNHLHALGAKPVSAFTYGALPNVAQGWVSAALYRWEVTARETVVVGIVGAGGLGRLLQAQITSFDYRAVLATLLVLIGLTVFVDAISAALRSTLR